MENKKWPNTVTALQSAFESPIPKDPYTDGQKDYVLTIEGADLVVATITPPASLEPFYRLAVRIRALAK